MSLSVDAYCKAGEEFCRIYYDFMDKKRHMLSKLFDEQCVSIWNGNDLRGSNDVIIKFIVDLPPTEHDIRSIDAQLIQNDNFPQNSVMITVVGTVKYKNNQTYNFHQFFIIIAKDNVWKVVSDVFRFI